MSAISVPASACPKKSGTYTSTVKVESRAHK